MYHTWYFLGVRSIRWYLVPGMHKEHTLRETSSVHQGRFFRGTLYKSAINLHSAFYLLRPAEGGVSVRCRSKQYSSVEPCANLHPSRSAAYYAYNSFRERRASISETLPYVNTCLECFFPCFPFFNVQVSQFGTLYLFLFIFSNLCTSNNT